MNDDSPTYSQVLSRSPLLDTQSATRITIPHRESSPIYNHAIASPSLSDTDEETALLAQTVREGLTAQRRRRRVASDPDSPSSPVTIPRNQLRAKPVLLLYCGANHAPLPQGFHWVDSDDEAPNYQGCGALICARAYTLVGNNGIYPTDSAPCISAVQVADHTPSRIYPESCSCTGLALICASCGNSVGHMITSSCTSTGPTVSLFRCGKAPDALSTWIFTSPSVTSLPRLSTKPPHPRLSSTKAEENDSIMRWADIPAHYLDCQASLAGKTAEWNLASTSLDTPPVSISSTTNRFVEASNNGTLRQAEIQMMLQITMESLRARTRDWLPREEVSREELKEVVSLEQRSVVYDVGR